MSPLPPEDVLDYPRPAVCEATTHRIRTVLGGETIVDTVKAWRVLETFHPPTYYVPRKDIRPDALVPIARKTLCEWKGQASYFDVVAGGQRVEAGAWTYPNPTPDFLPILGLVAFYAEPMDACFVGAEQVIPQPGNFYGGWVTANLTGPIKGAPGTTHW